MKLAKAQKIISDGTKKPGYRVSFEVRERGILRGDDFPDRDEELFATEEEAWEWAHKFAAATNSMEYVNILVRDEHFRCVDGYKSRILHKYPSDD